MLLLPTRAVPDPGVAEDACFAPLRAAEEDDRVTQRRHRVLDPRRQVAALPFAVPGPGDRILLPRGQETAEQEDVGRGPVASVRQRAGVVSGAACARVDVLLRDLSGVRRRSPPRGDRRRRRARAWGGAGGERVAVENPKRTRITARMDTARRTMSDEIEPLSHKSKRASRSTRPSSHVALWRPQRESNPRYRRERPMS